MEVLKKIVTHPQYDLAVLIPRERLDFNGTESNLRRICLSQRGDQANHRSALMLIKQSGLMAAQRGHPIQFSKVHFVKENVDKYAIANDICLSAITPFILYRFLGGGMALVHGTGLGNAGLW